VSAYAAGCLYCQRDSCEVPSVIGYIIFSCRHAHVDAHTRDSQLRYYKKRQLAHSITNNHARTGVGCHLEAFQNKLQLKICGTRTVRRVSVSVPLSVYILSFCLSVSLCLFVNPVNMHMNKDPAYQSTPTNTRTEQTITIHPQPSTDTLTPTRTHRHTLYTYLCACGAHIIFMGTHIDTHTHSLSHVQINHTFTCTAAYVFVCVCVCVCLRSFVSTCVRL